MDVQKRGVLFCAEEMGDINEETFAVSSSSPAETAFDAITGCIENLIMEEEFQHLQQSFMEKHYLEFDDSDENKLSYTLIFNEYVDMLEKHLEQQLTERIPDFNMNAFVELLMQRKEEVAYDIYSILLTFTDFMAFKERVLEYRAEKEGRGLDSSQDLVVISLSAGSKPSGSTEPQ